MWPTDKDLLSTDWRQSGGGQKRKLGAFGIIATNDRQSLYTYQPDQYYTLYILKYRWIIKFLPFGGGVCPFMQTGRGSHLGCGWRLANGHLVESKRTCRFNKGSWAGQPVIAPSVRRHVGKDENGIWEENLLVLLQKTDSDMNFFISGFWLLEASGKKRCLNYSAIGASENVNGKRLHKKELNKEQKQQTGQFKLCCHQTGNKGV